MPTKYAPHPKPLRSRAATRLAFVTVFALGGACTRESTTESSPQDSPKPTAPANVAPSPEPPPPAAPPAPPSDPMAAGSVVTPAGPDKGCDLAVELGKKTGTVKLEPGKTYCVLAARVQSTSTIDDVRKALPSTCKEDRRRGGTHLFCTEEGVRFAFAGPPGTLDSIAVFPKGDPSAGGFH